MKKIVFLSFLLLGLSGFQLRSGEQCEFNLHIQADWEEKLTGKSFPYSFVEKKTLHPGYDSTEMSKEELAQKAVVTHVFFFTSAVDETKTIQLSERVFHTPCAAYSNFKQTLTYFQSDQPRYEYNTQPRIFLIQGNRVFSMSAESGEEKLLEEFMKAFFDILLIRPFQKETVIVRHTSARAVLK